MSVSVEPIQIVEKIQDYLKERRFKKGRVRLIVDRFSSDIERLEVIIEGIWDTWVNSPPGLFLKDVEAYDEVSSRSKHSGRYTVHGATPEFSKPIRMNVQKKDEMFVSAHSIKWIEFCFFNLKKAEN